MSPRSIRRAAERKAKKQARKAAQLSNLQSSVPAEIEPEITHTVSDAQLAANRANALLSTGPASSEGRARSSLNAVKTALTGRTVLLPSDDAAAYQHHVHQFELEYRPIGLRECTLVQSIADTFWRLDRIRSLEWAIFAQGRTQFAADFEHEDTSARPALIDLHTFLVYEKQLRNLQIQDARLHRRFEKDSAELHQLQQERKTRESETAESESKPKTQRLDEAAYLSEPKTQANGFVFSTEGITAHFGDPSASLITRTPGENAAPDPQFTASAA